MKHYRIPFRAHFRRTLPTEDQQIAVVMALSMEVEHHQGAIVKWGGETDAFVVIVNVSTGYARFLRTWAEQASNGLYEVGTIRHA